MKVVLASASPRREQLLNQVGIACQVRPSQVEEVITKKIPGEVVEELSFQKAMDVATQVAAESMEEVLVIGADTVVAIGGEILGKPKDDEDAKKMLCSLEGKEHNVYTGVTLVVCKAGKTTAVTFHERTSVVFYPMTEGEIEWYVSTKEPEGKAGSYGIQGKSAVFIEKIEGDYNNVVGLPVARVYQEAKKLGFNLMK